MLILGSFSLVTFSDRDDYFMKFMTLGNLFDINNNDICHLRREMKKLIKPLPLTYGYHQFISITGKAKPSETVAAKSELSVSVILVDESKEEEMTLVLLSTLAKLVKKISKAR